MTVADLGVQRARTWLSARTPPTARRTVKEAVDDRLAQLAAATSFFAVLSIFPTLLLVTGFVDLVDAFVEEDLSADVRTRVTGALDLVLTDRASPVTKSVESFLQDDKSGLLTVAALAALVSVSGAWAAVVAALNQAYDTKESRTWLRRRVLGLVLGLATILVFVLTVALLVAGPLLGRGERIAELLGLGGAFAAGWNYLRWPVVALALMGWLVAVYRYGPNRTTRWRVGVPGALFTTVAWLVASAAFHLYVRFAGSSSPVLGALGGAAILMLWIYVLTFALLLGGELNAVLAERRDAAETEEAA